MPSQQQQSTQCKFDWYQSGTKVVISIVRRGLATDDCRLEYGAENKLLRVFWRDEVLFSAVLHQPVNPQKMSFFCTLSKVEVTLEKLTDERWPDLISASEESSVSTVATTTTAPKSTEWERLAKEVEEEEEKSEGVDRLFQQIYRDADDDVRKAMMKSFTESCGTVLSTNWSEIKAKKTEVKPPSDMEYKKYEL